MARVLVVGCGCRGRELATRLLAQGYAVRGTTRDPARVEQIEATGAEAVIANPDRLATIAVALEGVTVLCWLMGSAVGEPEAIDALHGPRLESLLGALVDTPVRGFVYEASGTVEAGALERGRALVEGAHRAHRMPVAFLEAPPADRETWLVEAIAGVENVLS
ncbi:MAG: NAD(P)H-binding protein [Thermoleophilaceae bacterium]|nr:NAD(P)H-binding protein [Thermoleophilaceae bacterium]